MLLHVTTVDNCILSNFIATLLFSGQLKPKLKELQTIVVRYVTADWYDLGIALLDDQHMPKLKEIERIYPYNAERCCIEMLEYWLKVTPSATWNYLIESLRSKLQLITVSERIESQIKGNIKVICVIYCMAQMFNGAKF